VRGDDYLEIPGNIIPDSLGNIGKIINGDFIKIDSAELYKISDLPYIVQITPRSLFLSADGSVWTFTLDLKGLKIDSYNPIIQIYEVNNNNYCLDNQGNILYYSVVNYIDSSSLHYKIKTSKNLIEICVDSDEKYIYALDDNMNLFIYDNDSRELVKNYDLLKL
jgi:hypothetical protein